MSKYNFKGWNLSEFFKTRKSLIVTLVSGIGTYLITQNPALTAIIAAATEMIYSIIDYYVSA